MMADWAWTSVTKALPPDNLLVLITGSVQEQKGDPMNLIEREDARWQMARKKGGGT